MMKKRNEVLKQIKWLQSQKRTSAQYQRYIAASYYAAQIEALQWMLGNEYAYRSTLEAHEHRKMIENVRERSRV